MLPELKVSPEHALAVGDEIRDIEAARDLGLKTAGLAWAFGIKPALEDAGPDFAFEAVEQFRDYVSILVERKTSVCLRSTHCMITQANELDCKPLTL